MIEQHACALICRMWVQIKATPGVSGLHAMPFSELGRKMTLSFILDNVM
jgi:hypothetical protein